MANSKRRAPNRGNMVKMASVLAQVQRQVGLRSVQADANRPLSVLIRLLVNHISVAHLQNVSVSVWIHCGKCRAEISLIQSGNHCGF